jgi:hypothetical protein
VHVPFGSQHQHLGIQLIPAFLFVIVLLSGAGQVKLADFGLAKVMANGLTVTTSFVGVSLPLASLSLLPVCWLGSIELWLIQGHFRSTI